MQTRFLPIVFISLFSFLYANQTFAQNIGVLSSAVQISNCTQSDYFNVTGSGTNLIGPAANTFTGSNLGVYTQNSGTLLLNGSEARTFKNAGSSNVCAVKIYYRVYMQSASPGSFSSSDLTFTDDCNSSNQYPSGGNCQAGNQKWNASFSPVDLTTNAAGDYFLEVYFEMTGDNTTATGCGETVLVNNGGSNYKASFSIQSPTLSSKNPSTCNNNDGAITISGLVSGKTYAISYIADGAMQGPANYTANSSGQVTISGLTAGTYSNFSLEINGCTTDLYAGQVLSNPVITPVFSKINPFCAGSAAPVLPSTSNNGISGTWNPAVVDNQNSAVYTFTPDAGQCAINSYMSVTVKPNIVPTFSFGTTITICDGGAVPALPSSSTNSISGSWSPSIIDTHNSAVYTFTPAAGQCATTTTLSVTVNPNITPTFSFGTSLTICDNASVPSLPAVSDNGINGTWSPSSIDNHTSASYTFTPSAGQCAVNASLSVTVNPNITPQFSFGNSLTICAGATVPALPSVSDNAVNGSWNPATVDNQQSGTYTFTPTAGQCALPTSFSVTVNPNITPVFAFGTSMTICENAPVPSLPALSDNGITGTWNAASIDNTVSGTYQFTPDAGQCATTASLSVTVNPNVVPTFNIGNAITICEGATVPALPANSDNGINGTWSPSLIDNMASASYTFTPAAGQCATTATFTVTVNPNVTPVFSFGTSLTICEGEAVPSLPAVSDNGVSGSWNPSVINNSLSGTYTFTPGGTQCAPSVTFTVTVNPYITPTFSFGTSISICEGNAVPVLTGTSDNGVSGTWNPAAIDNTNSNTYTFTPNAAPGQCILPVSLSVTVNPNVTPTFSFGTSMTICGGSAAPALPLTSVNGINGSWNPSVIDNNNSGNYVFTPASGQCATSTSLTVTVNPTITPAFSFGTSMTICEGSVVPALPSISDNSINGIWSPAAIDNQVSGTYTFTPDAGQCAPVISLSVTVNKKLTPKFAFGTSLSVCANATVPALPATSSNGVQGSWSPAVIDNQVSGTYTFTPDAGQCALSTNLTVAVNPNTTPVFAFGTSYTTCAGTPVPTLPSVSDNGIQGTWNPAIADNKISGTYTFTPSAGQCATPVTFDITITPTVTPTFSFGTEMTICEGSTVPDLTTTSLEGIDGTWDTTAINNMASRIYTFTPNTTPEQCVKEVKLTVTVNQKVTASFSFGTSINICSGETVPVLPATSQNGVTGTWAPAVISNQASGTYTFTATGGQCAMPTAELQVTVKPVGTINPLSNITINDGISVPLNTLSGSPSGVNFNWTNSNPAIGLSAAGTGNIPAFVAQNSGDEPMQSTVVVTPLLNGCAGTPRSYVITVNALDKDIFVPNVFSPNGDGKNDKLYVYGNHVENLVLRIFNQWGQQVAVINNLNTGWDGTFHNKPLPVGVFVYTLQAQMKDGRKIEKKGNITLLR